MDNLLRIQDISKSFPGVKALDNVSIDIRLGEVHAIVGENGAGKSTLMNILSGNYAADDGHVFFKGKEQRFSNPYDAQKAGFSIVHQERSLVASLTVAENVFVNRLPTTKYGTIDKKKLYRLTREILDRLKQTDIQPDDLVRSLSPAQEQMVEVCKAMVQQPKVLILDEPTATVTDNEAEILFELIQTLTKEGITVLYISHRLAEIFRICDRVSVLRDGKLIGTEEIKGINIDTIIQMMVGREIASERYPSCALPQEVLRVENLTGERFRDVSFSLHKGEILGFAGLAGAGRSEVARGIIGADPIKGGTVLVNGQKVRIGHPKDAIANGIGYLPEDRKVDGLFLQMSIEENIISGKIKHAAPNGLMKPALITKAAEKYKSDLNIITPSVKRKVVDLSGGNQQKVVIGKWLLVDSDILIVDEPTRGIDVGAKSEIYKLMIRMVQEGKSVIMISSDLPEVLLMSDRIVVMHNGNMMAVLDNRGEKQITEEEIMRYASGLKA